MKDLDDSVKTRDAEHTTVDDLFEQFMDIRKALRESSRCCYNDIYRSEKYSRMANLFAVLLGTGMRIGEALGLRWCDCDFEEGIIHVTHALLYKQGEDGNYRYRISAPKTEAGFREIPMFDEVKAALQRERGKRKSKKKKFVVDGYSDFVFLNNNGQVYTQSFVYDTIQGITTSYNKEEYAKALEEKREPCYLPKISAHILRHTFCTRMCEQNINIKVLQDVMGHRNIRTTMETYAKAFRDKKVEAVMALNGAFKIS